LKLSLAAPAVEPVHEVTLNVEPDKHTSGDIVYLDCFLIEVKSSKDQVNVMSTAVDVKAFKSLEQYVHIEIVGNVNYPEYFPKNIGKLIDGITAFKYKETPLKYVTRDDFKDMSSELVLVNLADNKIEEIPFDTFHDLTKLIYFDIRDNKIKRLAPNMFAKSPNFDTLIIESNEITELHPDLFRDCSEFKVLYAEFNNIKEFHEDLLKNNPNMTVISMRHNKIKNIPIDFNRFSELHVADFTHNCGTCDTMYFMSQPYVEYYNDEEQKKWIKTVPEFQQKVEEVCRG
jgi:Leucine-rich repeat (LRR) protein